MAQSSQTDLTGYISRMAVDNSRPQSENSAGQDSFSSLAFDFIFYIESI